MDDNLQKGFDPKVLVAIASYGEKNLGYLKQVIANYQAMAVRPKIVLFSEAPKKVDPAVEVIVGLPSSNPWSLPFAHKKYFAEQLLNFDLFVYTEDDIEIEEESLHAFRKLTRQLPPDEVAGFLRYEVRTDGTKILTDVHASYCWKPDSVKQHGPAIVAEFSNEHAGFYVLTRDQLGRAMQSGGYLLGVRQGRYGLPETAATDPYTTCGFRKVICISDFETFLIRHMSNAYVEKQGVTLGEFKKQIEALHDIRSGKLPAVTLCPVEPKVLQRRFYKSYYEEDRAEVLESIPPQASSILLVGCGAGRLEEAIANRNAKVTAIALDAVIGTAARRLGFEVLSGSFEECFARLGTRRFQAVVCSNLFHLLPDPWSVLRQCAERVHASGTLVVSSPNFRYLPLLWKRWRRVPQFDQLGSFASSGLHPISLGRFRREVRRSGLLCTGVRWFDPAPPKNYRLLRKRLGRLMARNWVLQSRPRQAVTHSHLFQAQTNPL